MTIVPETPVRERREIQRPNEVGITTFRADGVPKVKGEFEYASDMRMEGMLHGATLRSPHPRADIWGIDIGPALAIPGVHAVLTHADVPGRKTYGMEVPDQPVLAINHVRYQGEPVAIVAADHPETARRAADAIVVDYRELEPLTDAEAAMAPGAPELHPDTPDTPRLHGTGNVLRHLRINHGDPDADGRRRGQRRVRGRDAGPGLPRARVGAGGARRRGRGRPLHRDAVAARRPGPGGRSRSACRPRRCASPSAASAAPSAGARTSRCRSMPACSPCTPGARCGSPTTARSPSTATSIATRARCATSTAPRATVAWSSSARGSCSTAGPTPRARPPCAPTRRASPAGPTRCPTRASTATSSTPTTRRAGRCAASARCRSPSPTRRRWTGWPRRWAWTPSICGSSTPWAPTAACPRGSASASRRRWPSCSSASGRCRCRPTAPTACRAASRT